MFVVAVLLATVVVTCLCVAQTRRSADAERRILHEDPYDVASRQRRG